MLEIIKKKIESIVCSIVSFISGIAIFKKDNKSEVENEIIKKSIESGIEIKDLWIKNKNLTNKIEENNKIIEEIRSNSKKKIEVDVTLKISMILALAIICGFSILFLKLNNTKKLLKRVVNQRDELVNLAEKAILDRNRTIMWLKERRDEGGVFKNKVEDFNLKLMDRDRSNKENIKNVQDKIEEITNKSILKGFKSVMVKEKSDNKIIRERMKEYSDSRRIKSENKANITALNTSLTVLAVMSIGAALYGLGEIEKEGINIIQSCSKLTLFDNQNSIVDDSLWIKNILENHGVSDKDIDMVNDQINFSEKINDSIIKKLTKNKKHHFEEIKE